MTKQQTKITAEILYQDILQNQPEEGLYVWVAPDEKSILEIQKILVGAPFDPVNGTELHATVIYHEGNLHQDVDVPVDRKVTGTINSMDLWEDHKGKSILVALVDSGGLKALHRELLGEGFKHSYPDFTPHITLSYEVELTRELRDWYRDISARLAAKPLHITFDDRLKGSSLA